MPFTRTQIAERVAAAKEEYDDDDGWTKTDWDKWALPPPCTLAPPPTHPPPR